MAKNKDIVSRTAKKPKRKKIIKALYISIAVLVVAACGIGALAYFKFQNAWQNPGDTLRAGETDSLERNNDVVNLVLLGSDSSEEREARHMGARTDTIVICAINIKDYTVRAITIPRDTYIDGINQINNSGEVIGQGVNRINTAYIRGIHGSPGGDYQNTLTALEDLFGNRVPFKYYAAINMDGIAPLADAVGGVPVTLDATIPKVGQKGQTLYLKGKTAENYVRTRHGVTGDSDIGRAERQQAFFLGLARRIKEMGAVDAVQKLWDSLNKYIETNLSLEQMVAFGSILNKMEMDKIEFTMPVGTTGMLDGKSMFFPDDEALQNLALDTWFNLPDGTSLWTTTPRRTPSKILRTPKSTSYVIATPVPTPTPTLTPEPTMEPEPSDGSAGSTDPPSPTTSAPPATATPMPTATPSIAATVPPSATP